MKVLQAFQGSLTDKYKSCIDSVKACLPKDVGYEFVSKFPKSLDKTSDPRFASDLYRMQRLSKDGDLLWLDCDVEIIQWPVFEQKGKPYFVNNIGYPDVWAIYSNGCQEYFKKLFGYYKTGMPFAWYYQFMKDVYLMPNGCFLHHKLHTKKVEKTCL